MLSSPVLGVLMVGLFLWVAIYLHLRRDDARDDLPHSDDELFF
jgi:hypothetical protein